MHKNFGLFSTWYSYIKKREMHGTNKQINKLNKYNKKQYVAQLQSNHLSNDMSEM